MPDVPVIARQTANPTTNSIRFSMINGSYLVSITMTGPHAVRRMLPMAYGTV
jgi:hypothetical protein